jgi:L-alanine-DL-glutamate epimerase-like enolase superfamily enzyme
MHDFRLHSIETFVVALPARRPHLWVGLTSPAGHGYLVVKLRLLDGTIGWGEAQTIQTWGGDDGSRYGETPSTARALIDELLVPALKDIDLRQFELVHAAMSRVLRGHPYTKAAIEVAIMDAVGKRLNIPIYQILGGKVRGRVPIAHSIGLMEPKAAVDEAVRVRDEGVMTLKIKIGVEIERDVAIVRDVRKAVGSDVNIRVDGNQGYRTWREAVRVVERLMEYNIIYAEQLVDGVDELAKVAKRTAVPIMADESCWTERDVVRIAAADAAQYVSVYYTKPGGLYKAKRLLTVAGAHRMLSDINGSGEMGIGNAANLHLAAAAPEIVLAGTIPITSTADIQRTQTAGRKYLDDIIDEPFAFEDGCLVVPDGPGLGVTVDEAKLQKYRIN